MGLGSGVAASSTASAVLSSTSSTGSGVAASSTASAVVSSTSSTGSSVAASLAAGVSTIGVSFSTVFVFASSGSWVASFIASLICINCLSEDGNSEINQRINPHIYPISGRKYSEFIIE